ncbi:MAG: F0F1 ATP synthase subunit B [Candidatus Nomurabacteria bacterium]|jgi:F-type H+-transporting ATPase subunit b|nr:F0F1 ATP synthase subunit B [Candidatus Nomurabacteria bacterium]
MLLELVASSEAESKDMFGVLGIDWKVLVLQTVAFCILVFILAKWIYPSILAMLDRRQKLIDDSVKAAKETISSSEKATADIATQMKKARDEADNIVSAAHKQSEQLIIDAEVEAQKRTEASIAASRQQLARDVEKARKALRQETADLVALATEKVAGVKVDSTHDAKLVDEAIENAEEELSKTDMSFTRRQTSLMRDSRPEEVKKLLGVLVDYLLADNDTRQAGQIVRDVESVLLKKHGHLVANVTSAQKLSDKNRAEIIKMLKQETNAKVVELVETVDENIIGGIVVRTPDAELNAHINTRLEHLK